MDERVLWVTTDRFETTTVGANFINPRCFGEDFAWWLRSQLTKRGYVLSEPIEEDWGWIILIKLENEKLRISVGIVDESIGSIPAIWRLGVAYERQLKRIRSWLEPSAEDLLIRASQEVRAILADEPHMSVREREP